MNNNEKKVLRKTLGEKYSLIQAHPAMNHHNLITRPSQDLEFGVLELVICWFKDQKNIDLARTNKKRGHARKYYFRMKLISLHPSSSKICKILK